MSTRIHKKVFTIMLEAKYHYASREDLRVSPSATESSSCALVSIALCSH